MKMNAYQLLVMDELKGDPYFFKANSIIHYSVPRKNEKQDNKTFVGKILAVKDLVSLGVMKIHNQGYEKVSDDPLIYEFELIINHFAFEGIYKICILESKHLSLEQYEKRSEIEKHLTTLRSGLNQVMKSLKLGKKELKLLSLLADFKPKEIKELAFSISSKDIASLKKQVNSKLRNSEFQVELLRNNSSFGKNAYQLTFSRH